MSDDLSTSIENLRTTASQLNEITDYLNVTVKTVEKILGEELKIGISAYVSVDSETDDTTGATITQFLGYQRVGGNFRIVVLWENDFHPDRPAVKPWSDCARDMKIETAEKLPQLIQEISNKSKDSIRGVLHAAQTAERVMKSLLGKEA